MSLKLGLYRNKHKLCFSKLCGNLPSHSHSEKSLKNELLDNLLQPQLSQALMERERTFKQIYSSTLERCRDQTARSYAYRYRFKLGHHLEIGQIVLNENHKQAPTRSQKLQQRRLGPFTVAKRITKTTYQVQDDKGPTVVKTVHRNHLVEYYPKEGSLPALIEQYVPSDHQNENFYERFMEQRTRDLNNPSITKNMVPSHSQWNRYDLFRPQTSRNDLVCIITILQSPFRLLLFAPLCYHLRFLRKHQPPIHLLLNKHRLINCGP